MRGTSKEKFIRGPKVSGVTATKELEVGSRFKYVGEDRLLTTY